MNPREPDLVNDFVQHFAAPEPPGPIVPPPPPPNIILKIALHIWNWFAEIWAGYSDLIFVVGAIVLASAVLVAFFAHAMNADIKKWDTFKADHHCFIIGKKEGQTATTSNGAAFVSGQTGWKCDDGLEYWNEHDE